MGSTPEVAWVYSVCRLPGAPGREVLLDIFHFSHEILFLFVLIDILGTSDITHSHGEAICQEPR